MLGARVLLAIVVLLSSRVYAQDVVRLELSEPPAREKIRAALGWVQVAGRVSSGQMGPCDVVIALDMSESAFVPSGQDVDGDGIAGVLAERGMRRADGMRRPTRSWTTDPGDTVFELSRAMAREILDVLAQDEVRVGLVTFSDLPRVRARLGTAARARRALDSLRVPRVPRATHLEGAIRVGENVLVPWARDAREKILLVISDGRATRPGAPFIADRAARRAARSAGASGVSIYSVAVGPDAASEGSAYAEIAALTDGYFAGQGEFEALFAELPMISPQLPLELVEIANETTGDRGRAVRFFRDGSFDGFVRLAPGANRLAIHAHASDGTRLGTFRTVYFDPAAGGREDPEGLRRSLEKRSLEIDLARVAGRGVLRRRLEIEAEN